MKRRLTPLIAGLSIGAIALGGCSADSSAPADGQLEDTLNIVQYRVLNSFDPNIESNQSAGRIAEEVLEGLTTYVWDDQEQTYVIAPELATEWELTDANTWRFILRDDAAFSDGTPMTAADVVASFDFIVGAEKGTYKSLFDAYSVTAVDDHTVDVSSEVPDEAAVPGLFSLFRVYSADQLATEGAAALGSEPLGTGPYMIESNDQGVSTTLVYNPEWWGEEPSLKTLNFRYITEASTRVSELNAGSADVIDTVPPVLESQIEANTNLELLVEPFAGRRMILFNTNGGPTADEALRKAVNYAVDRDEIVAATGGRGYPLYGTWTEGEAGYDEDYVSYEYDPEKATEILDDAGLAGTSFTLTHQEGEETDETIALIVQEAMAAVGVTVNIESGPSSTVLTEFTSGQRAGAYVSNFAAIYPGEELLLSLHLTDNGSYSAAYGSPEVTALATELRSTIDPDERLAIIDDIQTQAIETEALWAPMLGYPLVYGVAAGLEWTPRQGNKYNFEDATFNR